MFSNSFFSVWILGAKPATLCACYLFLQREQKDEGELAGNRCFVDGAIRGRSNALTTDCISSLISAHSSSSFLLVTAAQD